MTEKPRRENWFLITSVAAYCMISLGLFFYACTTPRIHVENPTEPCAVAVAMSPTVQAQAVKLGLEPIELARRTCAAAILAAQVAEANLPKASGIGGATSSSVPPSMAAAGAAGAGGACTCIGHVPFGDRACTCIGGLAFGGG